MSRQPLSRRINYRGERGATRLQSIGDRNRESTASTLGDCEHLKVLSMRVKQRFDSIQQESYLSIWRTYDRLKALEDLFFAQWELTAQQYNVLRILQAHGSPLPTLTIANKLISRAPDVTRMLDRLEKQSWIVRVRSDSDRRSVLVEITPKGIKLLESMASGLTELHKKQLGHVPPAELQELCSLLAKIRAPHEPEGSSWG